MIVLGFMAVPLAIVGLVTWGIVVLSQRNYADMSSRLDNYFVILLLALLGLAGSAGVGCTAFMLLGS